MTNSNKPSKKIAYKYRTLPRQNINSSAWNRSWYGFSQTCNLVKSQVSILGFHLFGQKHQENQAKEKKAFLVSRALISWRERGHVRVYASTSSSQVSVSPRSCWLPEWHLVAFFWKRNNSCTCSYLRTSVSMHLPSPTFMRGQNRVGQIHLRAYPGLRWLTPLSDERMWLFWRGWLAKPTSLRCTSANVWIFRLALAWLLSQDYEKKRFY